LACWPHEEASRRVQMQETSANTHPLTHPSGRGGGRTHPPTHPATHPPTPTHPPTHLRLRQGVDAPLLVHVHDLVVARVGPVVHHLAQHEVRLVHRLCVCVCASRGVSVCVCVCVCVSEKGGQEACVRIHACARAARGRTPHPPIPPHHHPPTHIHSKRHRPHPQHALTCLKATWSPFRAISAS
jgi:hypothetical protein